MNKRQLAEYLVQEAEINDYRVANMTPFQMVNAWLKYNGIIGYTDDILDVIEAAYNINLRVIEQYNNL